MNKYAGLYYWLRYKINNLFFKNNPTDLNKPFIYKYIRSDDRCFWDEFVHGLVINEKTALRTTSRKKFTIRLGFLFGFYRRYEIVSIENRWSLFGWFGKKNHTQHQSVSFADPSKQYCPPVFNPPSRKDTIRVGIRMSPSNIQEQRNFLYDGGTVDRSGYDAETPEIADKKLNSRTKKDNHQKFFTSLYYLTLYAITNHIKNIHNEIMARLFYVPDGSFHIAIFEDSRLSKLHAQLRKLDLEMATKQATGINFDIPISFYVPNSSGSGAVLKYYTAAEQLKDTTTSYFSTDEDKGHIYLLAIIKAKTNTEAMKYFPEAPFATFNRYMLNLALNCSETLRGRYVDLYMLKYKIDIHAMQANYDPSYENNIRAYARLLRVLIKKDGEINNRVIFRYVDLTILAKYENFVLLFRYLKKDQYKYIIKTLGKYIIESLFSDEHSMNTQLIAWLVWEQRRDLIKAINKEYPGLLKKDICSDAMKHYKGSKLNPLNLPWYIFDSIKDMMVFIKLNFTINYIKSIIHMLRQTPKHIKKNWHCHLITLGALSVISAGSYRLFTIGIDLLEHDLNSTYKKIISLADTNLLYKTSFVIGGIITNLLLLNSLRSLYLSLFNYIRYKQPLSTINNLIKAKLKYIKTVISTPRVWVTVSLALISSTSILLSCISLAFYGYDKFYNTLHNTYLDNLTLWFKNNLILTYSFASITSYLFINSCYNYLMNPISKVGRSKQYLALASICCSGLLYYSYIYNLPIYQQLNKISELNYRFIVTYVLDTYTDMSDKFLRFYFANFSSAHSYISPVIFAIFNLLNNNYQSTKDMTYDMKDFIGKYYKTIIADLLLLYGVTKSANFIGSKLFGSNRRQNYIVTFFGDTAKKIEQAGVYAVKTPITTALNAVTYAVEKSNVFPVYRPPTVWAHHHR